MEGSVEKAVEKAARRDKKRAPKMPVHGYGLKIVELAKRNKQEMGMHNGRTIV